MANTVLNFIEEAIQKNNNVCLKHTDAIIKKNILFYLSADQQWGYSEMINGDQLRAVLLNILSIFS